MKRITIITAYFIVICIVGCLLAYPIYLLTNGDLERIVSRTILVLAVLLFYPTCKLLRIQDIGSIGWIKTNLIQTLSQSWLIGFIMLAPISFVFLYCGFRIMEVQPISLLGILSALMSALISGLLIGIIEEFIFRGLMQSQLLQSINTVLVVLVISAIYSSMHFLEASDQIEITNPSWLSGFSILSSAFANFNNIHSFIDAWLALFLAGIFLSIVKITTNNLVWCVGIHAGWVTHIKLFKEFTDRDNSAACGNLASSYDNYVGELSTILIISILLSWIIFYYWKNKSKYSNNN